MTESRRRSWVIGAVVLVGFAVIAAAVLLTRGSGDRKSTGPTKQEIERDDELAIVRDTLRRDDKLEACKTAVAQLNVYLSRSPESKPAPLTTAQRQFLVSQLRLTPDELKEVTREEFTGLDSHYLEESLLFRDAIASLKLNFADKTGAAALQRARLAFAWAIRQVWLNEQPGRPLPAAYALRTGAGSAAERAGVALAALQQAGVDAGLVGQKKDERTLRTWAIGVLIDGEVYLFDHQAGQPIAAADGKGIATLKQARANANVVNDLGADAKAVVADSRVWLAPPLSALSARMHWLQEMLSFSPPAVLAVEPSELAERFGKAGERAEFWNPPTDVASPTRRLSGFLSPAEGGFEPAADRLYARYRMAPVPVDQMPAMIRSRVIEGDPRERMMALFTNRFIELAQEPGKPRDQMLRGHFDEASHDLVEALGHIRMVQQRVGTEADLEKGALEWAEQMRSAYAALIRERENPATAGGTSAKARVDALYKASSPMALLIERAASEPYEIAVSYQMALNMHEQAERRSRDRSPAAAKRAAWENAAASWERFLASVAGKPWVLKAQLDHARRLHDDVKRELAVLPQ
jgi:hypothetical protein